MSRVIHYLFDATLLSVAFSGARRVGGFEFNESKIENETIRSVVKQYFGVGDWLVDYGIVTMTKYPEYFKRRS
ncbi:hypothetical protein DFJ73DRAFT_796815 [Zopfochytrium polystomum]|nr:hypothetical protein DFJ73DRAFT_796815 [Zopfochytrium polystomum]